MAAGADSDELAPTFPSSWRLLDDVEIMDLPDPQWIIEGIIPEKSIGVIYSPSGVGKTTAVAGILTAVASGRDWFGHSITQPGACQYSRR